MLLTDLTSNKKIELKNGLYIVSTPIGNRYDITLRAIYVLNNSNIIVCEDTRVTKKLFTLLNIKISGRVWISYNDYNAPSKIKNIIEEINKNKIVSFVSDAGTPLLSDPGYKMVQEALKNNIKVIPIPGPSAITASLIISGAKTDKFFFVGFLSRKKNEYVKILKKYSDLKAPLIIFEKSKRIKFLIEIVFNWFEEANFIITRELTKMHEEVIYVDITNFEKYIKKDFNLKGELTIILELNRKLKKIIFSNSVLLKELKKFKPSQVASILARSSSESREEIYKRCVSLTK
ncbi:MAG: 16S rRNA (cytidine(1402)-2'-O)-methyltransferase [Alphaproteobacteria bacterium TMED93]|nr:MAG: 16S rRNA (cytidine(1402)-2'-O)-methyltransferase [Alphaproteobacteria bacterium TMED93]